MTDRELDFVGLVGEAKEGSRPALPTVPQKASLRRPYFTLRHRSATLSHPRPFLFFPSHHESLLRATSFFRIYASVQCTPSSFPCPAAFLQKHPREPVSATSSMWIPPSPPAITSRSLTADHGFAICAQDLHVGQSLQISSFPPRGAAPHPTLCLGNFIKSFLANLIIRRFTQHTRWLALNPVCVLPTYSRLKQRR